MLEIKDIPYEVYGFTLRKTMNPSKLKIEDYQKYIAKVHASIVYEGCKFRNVCFENTSGLHCHGILEVPKQFNLIRFRIRGWSMKLEAIYDLEGWLRYCEKDQPLDEEEFKDDDTCNWMKKKLFNVRKKV